MHFDAIVIGGGAAGAFAAITAAGCGRNVALIEKNGRIGKKLRITGKGRCNVTNNCTMETLINNIPSNGRFMYSSLSQLPPADVIDFFEHHGVRLKVERGNRVFPQSDNAGDIVEALESELAKRKVTIIDDTVKELIVDYGVCTGVKCESGEYFSESVLIATGGKSYSSTGSTGDGYVFAQQAGHTVTPLVPSLVPLITEEKYCSDMMGLSLKNVVLSLYKGNNCIYSELGEMLFTHFGISGPLVLSASSHIRKMQRGLYKIRIDLKPGLTHEQLDRRVQRDFNENINKTFINSLVKLLPSKLIGVAVMLSGIGGDTRVNQITKEQRTAFVELLKAFPLTVKDFRPIDEAIITSGGVSVKEINPKTMESKLVSGLYFAGEVIDVDAYTGGFNLQIAFSTGYAAGMNI